MKSYNQRRINMKTNKKVLAGTMAILLATGGLANKAFAEEDMRTNEVNTSTSDQDKDDTKVYKSMEEAEKAAKEALKNDPVNNWYTLNYFGDFWYYTLIVDDNIDSNKQTTKPESESEKKSTEESLSYVGGSSNFLENESQFDYFKRIISTDEGLSDDEKKYFLEALEAAKDKGNRAVSEVYGGYNSYVEQKGLEKFQKSKKAEEEKIKEKKAKADAEKEEKAKTDAEKETKDAKNNEKPVKKSKSEENKASKSNKTSTNPKTGITGSLAIAGLAISSLFASLGLRKKND